jgi:hypothetical protein
MIYLILGLKDEDGQSRQPVTARNEAAAILANQLPQFCLNMNFVIVI